MAGQSAGGAIPVFDAAAVARALPYDRLVAALRAAFRREFSLIPRAVNELPGNGVIVSMPVASADGVAVKVATVFPDNPAHHGLPSIHALVLLLDAQTGKPQAVVDGTEATLRRTAAASALAADFLARKDARTLLMVGTGALAPHFVAAHSAVRSIENVVIWGRTPAKAEALAERMAKALPSVRVRAAADLARAVTDADIISCVTNARTPLIEGRWLKAGVHVDLVGSYSPDTRESDDDVMRNARIYLDTREGAMAEAGDVLIPLRAGVITESQIIGDLSDLCGGRVEGRQNDREITVFKSVGAAVEDLVAARLVLENSI